MCECRTLPLDASQFIHVYTHVLFEPSIYNSLTRVGGPNIWRRPFSSASIIMNHCWRGLQRVQKHQWPRHVHQRRDGKDARNASNK